MPVNAPVRMTMVSDRKPMKWMRSTSRPSLKGGMKTYPTACAKNWPNRPSAETRSRVIPPSAAIGRSGAGHSSRVGDENIARY